jgi:hypothetical protein
VRVAAILAARKFPTRLPENNDDALEKRLNYPFFIESSICSLERKARARMVSVGF